MRSSSSVALCLLTAWVAVAQAMSPQQLQLRLKIAQCRANCLDQFKAKSSKLECTEKPDCLMCWETCELLHNNFNVWGAMCNVKEICFPGCRAACTFHSESTESNAVPDGASRWIFPKQMKYSYQSASDAFKLEWSQPTAINQVSPNQSMVYMVLLIRGKVKKGATHWEEVTQTSQQYTNVERGILNQATDVKILAIASSGILVEKITPLTSSNDVGMALDQAATAELSGPWQPHLESLTPNRRTLGVEAMVSWPSLHLPGLLKYEVTWRVMDGAMDITGHLYTASNIATLNLWPNTVYSVQIRAFSDDGKAASEALIIDTRDMAPSASSLLTNCPECLRLEVIFGCAAGVALFLILLAVACCGACLWKQKSPVPQMARRTESVRLWAKGLVRVLSGNYFREAPTVIHHPKRDAPRCQTDFSQSTVHHHKGPVSPVGRSQQELLREENLPSTVLAFDFPAPGHLHHKSDDKAVMEV